jgi:uncharacterized protein
MGNKRLKREVRSIGQVPEIRVDDETKSRMLVGYAAVFDDGTDGSRYEYWGITETIATGAFSRAIKEKQDVRGLFNHDMRHVLGRRSSGTLRLEEDAKGLRYEIDLPDTTTGRDVEALVSRGDIDGSSFAFRVKAEEWRKVDGKDGEYVRIIKDVDLIDVGPVTFPAYTGTSSQARSEDDETQDELLARAAEATKPQDDGEENGSQGESRELEAMKERIALANAGV